MANQSVPCTIPKIIFQTWKTKDIPDKWKEGRAAISLYMPDWTHILMTDADNRSLIAEHFPDFLSTFDSFPYPIMRADAMRYAFLYKYGGLYFDHDVVLKRSLNDLFVSGNIFFANAAPNLGVTNSLMASAPGNPIWLEMIERMKKPITGISKMIKEFHVISSTGPWALCSVLKNSKHPWTILPNSVFSEYCERRSDESTWSGQWVYKAYLLWVENMWWAIAIVVIVIVMTLLFIGFLLGSRGRFYR